MTGKIFRNFVFVSFSVLAVSVALILWALYGRFSASLTAGLVQQTDLMAVGVEQAGLAYLDAIDTGDRVTLVAPDGTVLFDNRASAAGMENHADREEIRQALETGRGQAVRRSATISTRTVYVAHRLSDGTVLRVAGAQSTAAAMVRELIPVLALILCAALVLSLLLAFRLSRKIVTPILSSGVRAYLHDYTSGASTLEQQDGDEMGPFALALEARRITSEGHISKAMVLGCSTLLTSSQVHSMTDAQEFILRAAQFLVDAAPTDLHIMAKTALRPQLSPESAGLGSFLLVLLPMAVIFAALVVLLPRRHR